MTKRNHKPVNTGQSTFMMDYPEETEEIMNRLLHEEL